MHIRLKLDEYVYFSILHFSITTVKKQVFEICSYNKKFQLFNFGFNKVLLRSFKNFNKVRVSLKIFNYSVILEIFLEKYENNAAALKNTKGRL